MELFERSSLRSPFFRERLSRRQFDRDMREFLRRNDVVFFEWASGLLAAASQMPKTCGMVTRLHRYEMYRWADAVNWDSVDAVILVSEAKRQEFCRRFPSQAAKAVVIPEAVSLERFTVHERPFGGDLGIMCHFRPRKRIYDLVLTFSELLQEGSDLHLHIAGGRRQGSQNTTWPFTGWWSDWDLRTTSRSMAMWTSQRNGTAALTSLFRTAIRKGSR